MAWTKRTRPSDNELVAKELGFKNGVEHTEKELGYMKDINTDAEKTLNDQRANLVAHIAKYTTQIANIDADLVDIIADKDAATAGYDFIIV